MPILASRNKKKWASKVGWRLKKSFSNVCQFATLWINVCSPLIAILAARWLSFCHGLQTSNPEMAWKIWNFCSAASNLPKNLLCSTDSNFKDGLTSLKYFAIISPSSIYWVHICNSTGIILRSIRENFLPMQSTLLVMSRFAICFL